MNLKNVPGIAGQTRKKFADLKKVGQQAISKGADLSDDDKLFLETHLVGSIVNGKKLLSFCST